MSDIVLAPPLYRPHSSLERLRAARQRVLGHKPVAVPTSTEIDAAAAETKQNPSEAEKAAGNYRKGHIRWRGLEITIETAKGQVRSGRSRAGQAWSVRMPCHYGYIRRHVGRDRDNLDCMIGPSPESEIVFVVDQKNAAGEFDEHKCLIGCWGVQQAMDLYHQCYSPDWEGFMAITPMRVTDFKGWIKQASLRIPACKYVHFQPMTNVVRKAITGDTEALSSKVAARLGIYIPADLVKAGAQTYYDPSEPEQEEGMPHPHDQVGDMRPIWQALADTDKGRQGRIVKAIDPKAGGMGSLFGEEGEHIPAAVPTTHPEAYIHQRDPRLLSDEHIRSLPFSPDETPKVLANRSLPEGTKVGLRLNLNMLRRTGGKHAVQSVHKGSWSGPVIGYDDAVTVRNPVFSVSQAARANIASGRTNKTPMASVDGHVVHKEPEIHGVEVRFNPHTSHLFVRSDNGWAVRSADEATVHGHRAYVRGNIQYWHPDDAPLPLEGLPTDAKFNPDAVRSIPAKERLKKALVPFMDWDSMLESALRHAEAEEAELIKGSTITQSYARPEDIRRLQWLIQNNPDFKKWLGNPDPRIMQTRRMPLYYRIGHINQKRQEALNALAKLREHDHSPKALEHAKKLARQFNPYAQSIPQIQQALLEGSDQRLTRHSDVTDQIKEAVAEPRNEFREALGSPLFTTEERATIDKHGVKPHGSYAMTPHHYLEGGDFHDEFRNDLGEGGYQKLRPHLERMKDSIPQNLRDENDALYLLRENIRNARHAIPGIRNRDVALSLLGDSGTRDHAPEIAPNKLRNILEDHRMGHKTQHDFNINTIHNMYVGGSGLLDKYWPDTKEDANLINLPEPEIHAEDKNIASSIGPYGHFRYERVSPGDEDAPERWRVAGIQHTPDANVQLPSDAIEALKKRTFPSLDRAHATIENSLDNANTGQRWQAQQDAERFLSSSHPAWDERPTSHPYLNKDVYDADQFERLGLSPRAANGLAEALAHYHEVVPDHLHESYSKHAHNLEAIDDILGKRLESASPEGLQRAATLWGKRKALAEADREGLVAKVKAADANLQRHQKAAQEAVQAWRVAHNADSPQDLRKRGDREMQDYLHGRINHHVGEWNEALDPFRNGLQSDVKNLTGYGDEPSGDSMAAGTLGPQLRKHAKSLDHIMHLETADDLNDPGGDAGLEGIKDLGKMYGKINAFGTDALLAAQQRGEISPEERQSITQSWKKLIAPSLYPEKEVEEARETLHNSEFPDILRHAMRREQEEMGVPVDVHENAGHTLIDAGHYAAKGSYAAKRAEDASSERMHHMLMGMMEGNGDYYPGNHYFEAGEKHRGISDALRKATDAWENAQNPEREKSIGQWAAKWGHPDIDSFERAKQNEFKGKLHQNLVNNGWPYADAHEDLNIGGHYGDTGLMHEHLGDKSKVFGGGGLMEKLFSQRPDYEPDPADFEKGHHLTDMWNAHSDAMDNLKEAHGMKRENINSSIADYTRYGDLYEPPTGRDYIRFLGKMVDNARSRGHFRSDAKFAWNQFRNLANDPNYGAEDHTAEADMHLDRFKDHGGFQGISDYLKSIGSSGATPEDVEKAFRDYHRVHAADVTKARLTHAIAMQQQYANDPEKSFTDEVRYNHPLAQEIKLHQRDEIPKAHAEWHEAGRKMTTPINRHINRLNRAQDNLLFHDLANGHVQWHSKLPRAFFHGTGSGSWERPYDMEHGVDKVNANGLRFGPGFYNTADHRVGMGYAKMANGLDTIVHPTVLNVKKAWDADQHLHPLGRLPETEAEHEQTKAHYDHLASIHHAAKMTGTDPNYSTEDKAHQWHAERLGRAYRTGDITLPMTADHATTGGHGHATLKSWYDHLHHTLGHSKVAINKALMAHGYDAILHKDRYRPNLPYQSMGGTETGHQVVIPFKAENSKSLHLNTGTYNPSAPSLFKAITPQKLPPLSVTVSSDILDLAAWMG